MSCDWKVDAHVQVRVGSLAYNYHMRAHAPLLQQSGRPAKREVSIALPKHGRVHRQVTMVCTTGAWGLSFT